MKLKPDQLEVDSENPFKGDLLGREETCETWTQFIKQENTPFVLAVDTEWGDGKTTFLEMWQASLKKKGFNVVFFDAWKADFYDEALPALIGEIHRQLKLDATRTEKGIQLLKEIPVKGALKIVASLVPFAGEALSKAIDIELKEYRRVSDYSAYRKAVDEFKEELQKIAEKEPLVIFIDELDRCRPIFAIEVLEKVKHIFDVKGVFFAIALNKKVLSKTIESQYGEIDGNIYLEKFFDKVTTLENSRDAFLRGTLAKATIDMEPERQEFFIRVFLYISGVFNLSLRTQERMVNLIDIGVNIPGDNLGSTLCDNRMHHCILLFLTAIHATEYELFRKVVDLLNRQDVNQTVIPDESLIESLNEKIKLLKQFADADYASKKEVDVLCLIIDKFVGALNGGGANYNKDVEQLRSLKITSSQGIKNEMIEFYNNLLSYTDARKFFRELVQMIDLTKHWSSEQDSE